jgi:hypothetical protein
MLPTTITVEVTQEDINSGIGGCPTGCAIALALHRVGVDKAEVGDRALAGYYDGRRVRASLPLEARNFILGFDCHKDMVEPMSFQAILY